MVLLAGGCFTVQGSKERQSGQKGTHSLLLYFFSLQGRRRLHGEEGEVWGRVCVQWKEWS